MTIQGRYTEEDKRHQEVQIGRLGRTLAEIAQVIDSETFQFACANPNYRALLVAALFERTGSSLGMNVYPRGVELKDEPWTDTNEDKS